MGLGAVMGLGAAIGAGIGAGGCDWGWGLRLGL